MLRKSVVIVLGLMFSCFFNQSSYGQERWISFSSPVKSKPVFNLQYSGNEKVLFTVEIVGMGIRDILEQGGNYQRVMVPDQRVYEKVGFPEIPVVRQLIAIPDCDDVKLTVTPMDCIELEGYYIYPVPRRVERYAPDGYVYPEEEFTINDHVYSVDCYFPNYYGRFSESGSIREQRVISVEIYPIQFNPIAKKIRIYSSLKIELNFISPKSAVVKNVGPFLKACSATILNYK